MKINIPQNAEKIKIYNNVAYVWTDDQHVKTIINIDKNAKTVGISKFIDHKRVEFKFNKYLRIKLIK